MIVYLRTLHSLGYVHCDLKLGNLCAELLPSGKLAFTMIDFGVSQRIITRQNSSRNFRGNYVFSSLNHLKNGYADQLDDLYSLVYMAYKFVYKELPWE